MHDSNFKILDNMNQLKQEMSTLAPKSLEGPCIIPIDHAFNIKGIGTVILGVMARDCEDLWSIEDFA